MEGDRKEKPKEIDEGWEKGRDGKEKIQSWRRNKKRKVRDGWSPSHFWRITAEQGKNHFDLWELGHSLVVTQ